MIDKNLGSALSPRASKWFAYAIAGMICADGVVDEEELVFLKQTINFLSDVDEINGLIEMVKKRELPDLQQLNEVNRKTAFQMLKGISRIAITDSRVAKSEEKFLKYAGKQLGFENHFIDRLIRWANGYYSLMREEENLQRLAVNTEAKFF